MKPHKKPLLNQYWGPAALGIFLLLWAGVCLCKWIWGFSLRSVPQIIFSWLGVAAASAFLIWLNIHTHRMEKSDKPAWMQKAIRYVLPTSIVCVLTFIMLAASANIVSYRPEHSTEKYGYPLIARVHSFPDEYVRYYLDIGLLFYGQEMGYEYYGSDPLSTASEPKEWEFYDLDGNVVARSALAEATEAAQPQAEIKKLEITVAENREQELVFTVSMDDFIESYNSFYFCDKNTLYLSPQSQWRAFTYETAIHSAHETTLYEFTADEAIWSQPTITVYVPTNTDAIQEITVNFDEHGYSEAFYAAYEELCFYTLKVFFPSLSDEAITELYREINRLGKLNTFPNEEGYNSESIPCVLYYQDGVGVYPYFAIGEWVHLCIIPVTEKTISDFAEKGVEIHEIGSS